MSYPPRQPFANVTDLNGEKTEILIKRRGGIGEGIKYIVRPGEHSGGLGGAGYLLAVAEPFVPLTPGDFSRSRWSQLEKRRSKTDYLFADVPRLSHAS